MDAQAARKADATGCMELFLPKGVGERTIREISKIKREPGWMLEKRLQALAEFQKKPMPSWGPDLSGIDFSAIGYYNRPAVVASKKWASVPKKIRDTFEKLGIPKAEREYLAGAGAQFDSEAVYENLRESLSARGVVFCDADTGLREHGKTFRKYFGTLVPASDNKFAALNTAVWSGGSFVIVPPGVSVEIPLQAYFWMNAKKSGQFERTLLIAQKGSSVHYIEGCSAPRYSSESLHAAVVEIFAQEGAKVRYTTIQNWSDNVYNLVTKRAVATENAAVEWVDGNFGSRTTMKYPCVILKGRGSRADMVSVAFAGKGQDIDAGVKMIHIARDTTSKVVSKSVSKNGGHSSFRGIVRMGKSAANAKSHVECNSLLLDGDSSADTFPSMAVANDTAQATHEAAVSRLDEEKLFYMRTRGFTADLARQMLVHGFVEPFSRELPMEYAVEMNRLLSLQLGEEK